MKSYRK